MRLPSPRQMSGRRSWIRQPCAVHKTLSLGGCRSQATPYLDGDAAGNNTVRAVFCKVRRTLTDRGEREKRKMVA